MSINVVFNWVSGVTRNVTTVAIEDAPRAINALKSSRAEIENVFVEVEGIHMIPLPTELLTLLCACGDSEKTPASPPATRNIWLPEVKLGSSVRITKTDGSIIEGRLCLINRWNRELTVNTSDLTITNPILKGADIEHVEVIGEP